MAGWRVGLVSLGGLALLAVLLVTWLDRPAAPPAAAPAAPGAGEPAEGRVERLQAELEDERGRSRELAAQVAWLQAQLALLGRELEAEDEHGVGDGGDGERGERLVEEERDPQERWFDDESLRSRGVPEDEIARLKDRFAATEMQRIELQHKADREGWSRKPRYWKAVVGFEVGLRSELGDESYDLMLYATGRKNRVVIRDLLADSPGETYGFESGDVVLSYDGQRIFRPGELRRATTAGERGDWIIVEVLRDGEKVRVRAQRGPIGARLRPARVLPEALW